jgi:AAA domain
MATHSNLLIQETPMSAHVSRKVRSLIESNALCHGPDTRPGLMVNGGGCQGKTETVCEALACFEDEWLALYAQNPGAVAGTLDLHAPAACVRTPVKATPISACQRILDFYGEPCKGMRQEDLIRTVKNAVYDHGTKALVIDDVTRLKLHREADQDVLDLIQELMSLPVTLILVGVGIPKSGLLRDGPGSGCSRRSKTAARAATTTPPGRPTCGSTSSTSTGSATAPRLASPPGPPTWSASSSSCGCCAATTACSPAAARPSTCSAAPAGSSAWSGSSSRKDAGTRSRPAASRSPPNCSTPWPSAPLTCLVSTPVRARSPTSPRRPPRAARKPRKSRSTVFDDRGVPAAGTAG